MPKIIVFLILMPLYGLGQNLVPNPSFEEISSVVPCGWIENQFTFDTTLINWYKPSFATPDIYSMLVEPSCRSHCFSEPQDEARGWQAPRTGNNMIGVVTTGVSCNGSANLWKEYATTELMESLELNEIYYAEFYTSQADFCLGYTNYLGMYFSTDSITEFDNCSILQSNPQIIEESIIYEQENWYKVSGTFIAEETYSYLTIGNFGLFPDMIADFNPFHNYSIGYYFIDDVTVRKACQSTTEIFNICQGDELTLSSEINEFVGWAESNNPSQIVNTEEQFIVSPTANTTYFGYTVCDTATIHVQVNPTANFSLGADTLLCPGDTILLSAPTTAASFFWSNNSSESVFEITNADTYWIEMEDDCGTYVDTIEVSLIEPVSIDFGEDVTLCFEDSLTLGVSIPNAEYIWQDNSTEPFFIVTEEGLYSVSVDDNCTNDSDEIEISYHPEIPLSLPENLVKCNNDSLELNTNVQNATYLWQDGSTDQNYLVTQEGIYSVEVTQNGCLKSDSVFVAEDACEIILDMPNVFSPNGDEINDHFKPIDLSGLDSGNIKIFNRWGGLVFSSASLATGWDGSCEAHSCVSGTYFWVIEYLDINGNNLSLRGDIMLMR